MTHAHAPLLYDRLAPYFREAFKPREAWRVGIEVEKSGIDAQTGRPIPFRGPEASVESVLRGLLRLRGGRPVFEGDALVGVDAPWGSISLEPGGQVEWSSRPASDLEDLRVALDGHLAALRAVGDTLGVRWLDTGLHPDAPVASMPWMPKARYAILRDHLGARGRLAHRMMTQTLSIQCAFDFEDDEDWTRKFRAAALLTPVAAALFANSSRADGAETGWRSFRHAIWLETDPDRCGLPAIVFEPGFGIDRWVEWACSVPTVFLRRDTGLVPSEGVPFGALLGQSGCDAVTVDDWELHLSTLFTEVRSYTYIEARSADLLPDALVMAVPAFWTGLLYHPDALAAALDLGRGHDGHDAWRAALTSAARLGLEGEAGGRPLKPLAERALGLAAWGLAHGATCAGGGGIGRPLEALARRHGLSLRESGP